MKREEKGFSGPDKIAFIGAGRMSEALISGLLAHGIKKENLAASDISKDRLTHIATHGIKAFSDNQQAADFGNVIVLAVKPQVLPELIKNLKIKNRKLVISIAAGIGLKYLEAAFEGSPVIRAMPNNPALVGEGVTAVAYGSNVNKANCDQAAMIFKAVGEVVEVTDELMDAVTALSGSGPAYVYLFAEALAEAGQALGMNRNMAEKLAVQTLAGSARTLKKSKKSARELKEMVISPGGTTIEGLRVLEDKGFRAIISEAIAAAARRAKELSKEWTH